MGGHVGHMGGHVGHMGGHVGGEFGEVGDKTSPLLRRTRGASRLLGLRTREQLWRGGGRGRGNP
eukprot:7290362-Prymnesium_polylepis.1